MLPDARTQALPLMAAGVAGLCGGLLAVLHPADFAVATTTLVGTVLLFVAALQGWASWRAAGLKARGVAALIAVASLTLGVALLFGPFGDGRLMRGLFGLLLLASGLAKLRAGLGMGHAQNRPLVLGAALVSALLGLLVWLGLERDIGVLLGVELLASGLASLLLGMHRKAGA